MLISAPIVARALGPEGRGETAAALALFIIVPVVLNLGMPLEVRRQAATSDGHAVMRTARLVVAASFSASSALAAATYFTAFAAFTPYGRLVATIGILLAPLTSSWSLDSNVLLAHRRYGSVFCLQVLQPISYVMLILIFWSIHATTVATVLAASIAGSVATFVAGRLLVRIPIRGVRVKTAPLLKQGLAFFGSALAEAASNKADQVIALPLIGAYQAGLYSVAATIGAVPMAIGNALGASYFAPIAQSERQARSSLQGDAVRTAIAAAIMVIPAVAIAAWVAIPIVFGDAFAPSRPVTMIALIGCAATLPAFVASLALAADGQGIRMTIAQIGSLVIGTTTLLALGPHLGAIGAAIASTLGSITLISVLLMSLRLPAARLVPRPSDFLAVVRRLRRD